MNNMATFASRAASWLGSAMFCFAVLGTAGVSVADTILSETFEGSFPSANGWSVGDANGSGTPAYWDDVQSSFGGETSHGGNWMGYCAGVGYAGTFDLPTYQNSMTAYMEKTLDLSGYSSASLSFYSKIPSLEAGLDGLLVYVNGSVVATYDTTSSGWVYRSVSLPVGGACTIRLEFKSDGSVVYEGAYVDDIVVSGTPRTATIFNAWWSNTVDNDGDGYKSSAWLCWDADVVGGSGTLSVYEKIYYKLSSSSGWTLFATTSAHTINGANSSDWQYRLITGGSHNLYDWLIEVYRDGMVLEDYYREPANDSDLDDYAMETPAEDPAPAGSVQLSGATYSVNENGGTVMITVTRTGGSAGVASVNFTTASGTATADSDYAAASGMLTWGVGDAANKTFTVTILDDGIYEGNETFAVNLSGAGGASLGSPASATVTINDNETPPTGSVQLSNAKYTVNENDGTVTITATRTGSSAGAASVNYATANGTATAGSDYTAKSGMLNWAAGDAASKTFTVTVLGGGDTEVHETFAVNLSGAVGASLGSPATTTVIIYDNDISHISLDQEVYFSHEGAAYWAMIRDYTHGVTETSTTIYGGFVSYDCRLDYSCGKWDVQVAYLYDSALGRYIEALALRNYLLY